MINLQYEISEEEEIIIPIHTQAQNICIRIRKMLKHIFEGNLLDEL